MNVVPEPLPGGPALARGFMDNDETAAHFYGGHFHKPHSKRQRAAWLDESASARADRGRLTEVLRAYNAKYNNHEAVRQSLDLLERPETLVVAGGQQSGLFTDRCLSSIKRSRPSLPQKMRAGSWTGRSCRCSGLPERTTTGTRSIIRIC